MNNWVLEVTDPGQVIDEAVRFKDRVWEWVTNADMWATVLFAGIRILLIFIITRVIIKVVSSTIDRSLERESRGRLLANNRRFSTVGGLLKNVVTFICNFVMIMLILSEFQFDLKPLLAGAGVVGLAIGFGSQSLVKDVITGFFIIFEDQFAVGDVIQSGTYKGTVEMIGLRTTRLLSATGEVHIIPNGTIVNVTNYSLANALAVVDVPVKIERGLEATLALIGDALKGIEERSESVIAYPNILGIQSMSTSEYVIRVAAGCHPNARDSAERQIQNDIKQALERQSSLEAAKAEQEAREQAERDARAIDLEKLSEGLTEAREEQEAAPRRQIAAAKEAEEGEE
ncbi:mechanosensitive ion channel family protein [Paenibacillus sp. MMS20-IR301]|uniref:mechanosensitive ion channel family protein n=1 Tax=Paenibacillus sp. MMS20-IR301 TaxID=2895946 RepID=UPI0028EE3507|nr:mechanosensitive ion channel family protein [Paenibacillus sp. MMS20-IR301]WNS47047.1 mechanosensitive ion channel family protein [Paenibacillus sp. MMS20-IR301]